MSRLRASPHEGARRSTPGACGLVAPSKLLPSPVSDLDTEDPLRLGVVGYLNALPLIDGLEGLAGLELRHSVPSRLVDRLVSREVDVALCSSIDCQRSETPLRIVPVGMLGCRGATLTVRLFSSTPLAEIGTVHADTDSHTSVALLQVLLRERFDATPRIEPLDPSIVGAAAPARVGGAMHPAGSVRHPEAMLLIGDKVVTGSPAAVRYPHQLDLGAAWFEWTGKPFVFAVWMARADADRDRVSDIAAVLDRQRRHNRDRLGTIVHRHAAARGWPVDLAAKYLGECLRYDFDDEARQGLELFLAKCAAMGLVSHRRPLERFLDERFGDERLVDERLGDERLGEERPGAMSSPAPR